MSLPFPSLEFFEALKKSLAENSASTEGVTPSEAYCGFAIDDSLYVLEFDGRECSAVVSGGNPLDLDFVVAAPRVVWRELIAKGEAQTLAKGIEAGAVRIETEADDGKQLALAALPMLQAFVDQAQGVDIQGG